MSESNSDPNQLNTTAPPVEQGQATTNPEVQSVPPATTAQPEAAPQGPQLAQPTQPVQGVPAVPQAAEAVTSEMAWPDAQQSVSQPQELAPNQAEVASSKTGSKVGLILGLLVALGIAIVVLVLL